MRAWSKAGVRMELGGHTLATGSLNQKVILWDVSDRARPRRLGQLLTGHSDSVNSVAVPPMATP